MTVLKDARYRLKTKITHKLTDDRYVFHLVAPEKLDHRRFDNETVHHFKQLDEIPEAILKVLPQGRDELAKTFDLGLRMVVLMVDDMFGSLVWARLGRDFEWIMPVLPNDRMMGRCFTNPALRGKGLVGRGITAMLQETFDGAADGGRVLSDCHINNDASIRQFLKSGAFKLVARVRPLTPKALDKVCRNMGIPRQG